MKKESKEKKVTLCKEVPDENGKMKPYYKTVTESQAELVYKMGEAALYLADIAEHYEKEMEKTSCEKCKIALRELADENLQLASDLALMTDRFVFMCDLNGEVADNVAPCK